jgi:hypothetical protein
MLDLIDQLINKVPSEGIVTNFDINNPVMWFSNYKSSYVVFKLNVISKLYVKLRDFQILCLVL